MSKPYPIYILILIQPACTLGNYIPGAISKIVYLCIVAIQQ